MLPALLHLVLVLAGSPVYTLLAYRRLAGRGLRDFETAAAVRRRVLRNSALLELFLVYSFLLLSDKHAVYASLENALGLWGVAGLATAVILVAYGLGCWTRATIDRQVRDLDGSTWSHFRLHVLLLFLRMGVFVVATPLFYLPIYDLTAPIVSFPNGLGFTIVTLLFFLYVLRGPQMLFSAFGILDSFPDRELEEEIHAVARDRRIPMRRIRILRTWQSRFAAAFAHFGSSQIFVTDHCTEVVDRDELKAVLYHEVGHLGQLRASVVRVIGSYLVFLVFVYLKAIIDAASARLIGYETLIPGFLGFAAMLVLIQTLFGRLIREGEVRADVFSANLVGGRKLYHRAIAKILIANGLSVQFSPSAAEVIPGGGEIDEALG